MSRFTQFANPSAKSFLLRGGHVIRRKGGAASMIPQIAELRLSVSSTAISAALMFGAGLVGTPAALAGTCVETALGSGIFECSDPADAGTDTTQILFGAPVSVTTQAGFGITTAAGDAFIINGTNGTSLNDAEASVITGQQNGISANNTITGSLTLTSSGTVTGLNGDGVAALAGVGTADLSITTNIATGAERGIEAFNFGTGVLTVNSTGTASGTISVGIGAINSANGTDLNIASANAFGGDGGIYAYNSGTGALTVTSTGIATGVLFDGIYAVNSANGTDLTVTAANTNGGDNGISASNLGTGALTVTSTGMATGTNENGIYVYNSSNGTGLTVNAIDSNGGRTGIFAENDGSGALSITSTGSATGINGYGIFASNSVNGTDLTVTAVDTSGDDSGIGLENDGTGALIAISTGTATGTNDDGIEAVNSANGTDLTITAAHTNGLLDGIDARNSGAGALTIVSTGTATGTNGDGIDAANNAIGTGLMITAADTNGGQNGIDASNGGIGALTVISTGTAIGANANGINAVNSGVGTVLSITAAEVIGGTNGIRALSFGTAGLTISASGDVTGQTADGIYAYNNVSASMLINQVEATTITGAVDGIYANNLGGSLTINALGTVIGLGNDGIDAINAVGTTDLSIISNVATGDGNGIDAANFGTGALTITSTGIATGSMFDGIYVYNSANGTDLTVAAADTNGGDYGIYAFNLGTGALTITSTGTARGTASNGISVSNSVNSTDLTVNAVDTNGGNNGISTINLGTGALTITSTGMTTGTGAFGVYAFNSANGTDLTVTAADTNGGIYGVYARNQGTGALAVTSTGMATGGSDEGIYAFNSINGSSLTINAAETLGGTNGIRALNLGTAGLTISTTGDVTGQSADGIYAYNSANDVSASMLITQAAGTTITGAVDGIYANNLGGSLTINALGTVIGLADDGIDARNAVGTTNLSITSDVATGADNGVFASNLGTGALMITSTGTATGSVFIGIVALNSANGTDLTVTADNVTGGIHGIYAVNQGAGPLAITTSGTVEGGIGTAVIAATAGSTIAVNNNGTLESGAGLALVTNGGVTTLTNTGTINGGVQLSAFNDVSNNSGVFNAVIDSDFGAGNDLFTNTGTVASAGAVTLIDLEQFTNSGLVTMTNDVIGDVFTIDGAYVGDNGTLGFDVNFDGAGVADTLVILGAATGTTLLSINDISISPNFDNTILVVDAGAGSAADAFTLDLESPTIGFLTYDLFFEMAANDFFLSNTIGTPVFQTLKFAEGAQSLWYRSADAWAAHMASRRDAPDSALWMQTYGATTDRDESSDFTSGGFSQAITLDYSQDYFGLQAGYDFGPGATDGEGVLFGVTGGYLNSTLGFEGLADRVEYDVFNIGAYAGFKAGGFFANALAKYDFIDADVTAPTPGYSAQLDGEAYGARFEAGYRMGGDSFFAESVVSIEYQRSNLDDFSALGATIDFDRFKGLRGMAGLRLGGQSPINGANTLTYYAGGHAVKEFEGDDGLLFTSGTSSIRIANDPQDTFGRFELGVNIATPGGVTGFIEGNADIGGDYQSYGGRAGLRIRF